jgi:MFS family permease
MPLRQTVVFVLVPRHLASNAVALIQTGWSIMRSVGPAAAGLLILWLGPGGNFLIQASAYGLIAINTLRIEFPPHQGGTTRRSVLGNVREGLAYVVSQPVTRAFLVMGWMLPLFIVPVYVALSPIYAKAVFHGGPEVLGLLVGCVGVGGIAGGIFTASISRVDRRGLVQIVALFLTALSLIGFALSTDLWLAVFFLGLSGFFELIFLTGNQTLLQLSIPDELRGRVTSITTLSAGLAPLGAFSAGAGSDLIGPRAITLILSGAAATIAVLVYLFVPVVRDYRISHAVPR